MAVEPWSVKAFRAIEASIAPQTRLAYDKRDDMENGITSPKNDLTVRNRNLEKDNSLHPKQNDANFSIESNQYVNKDESEENEKTGCKGFLGKHYNIAFHFFRNNKTTIQYVIYGILIAAYLAMVTAACILNFHRALALFVLTVLGIFFIFWDLLMARYEDKISESLSPCRRFLKVQWFWLKWVVWIALAAALVCWLVFDTAKQGTNQLISFGGLAMFVFLMLIFSKYPTKVVWRPVIWGIAMQFVLGLITLRTKAGFDAFNWLGVQVQTFLGYTDAGAEFVFGKKYTDHFFAFKVLPIVIFFSTVMSMLYHIGFMQWLIKKVGWVMQITLGTSPVESLVAAGNIFVGQTESPLLVKPYLVYVTKSELHAIMTAGFATIAGSVLGAYISFGVSASHLLTASVMSAPAALAISKLFWPETEIPQITAQQGTKIEKGDSKNLLEAASQGASASISLVANIAANLIAFLALLSFFNAVLSWLGNMFDYPQLSFEIICAYVFMPFSFMMGVDWEDSFIVGKLLGYKTFFNEFVAYEHLSKLIHLRKEGGQLYIDGVKQYLSIRSETIATYALCGFANFGSLGLVIGGLTSMAPTRKRDIAGGALRAMIAGTVACFMTACIAGILSITEDPCNAVLENNFNTTSNSSEIVQCCLNLLNSATANNSTGNYNVTTLSGCCTLLNWPTFNCSWTA
ncbi:solute carrier family 28 member 3 [Hemicordylus capensis]|uniref:solute carrier family 28 member 3 n=1 Tax=Hemicordylus capensis TaxID=884348 RepID=UPI002302E5D0|nr:solute carrier family 28 member 3 [Hemicordylus capensis]